MRSARSIFQEKKKTESEVHRNEGVCCQNDGGRERKSRRERVEGMKEGRQRGSKGRRERGIEELIHVGEAPRVDIVGTFCKPCENTTNH